MCNVYVVHQRRICAIHRSRSAICGSVDVDVDGVDDDWTELLDSGGQIDVIYTDFAKAFDKVPHQRLLAKLRSYGITKEMLQWIENFLCNRKQCVIIKQGVIWREYSR